MHVVNVSVHACMGTNECTCMHVCVYRPHDVCTTTPLQPHPYTPPIPTQPTCAICLRLMCTLPLCARVNGKLRVDCTMDSTRSSYTSSFVL